MAENKFFDKINLEHYHRYVSGMIKRLSDNIDERIDEKFKNFIEDNVSDGEILDARGGERTLGDRLDRFDSQLAHIANNIIYMDSYPRLENEDDDTKRFVRAIEDLPNGGVINLSNKTYEVKTVSLKSNITIKGVGDKSIIKQVNDSPMYNHPIEINNCKNVKLENFKLEGNRNNQTNIKHGIYLLIVDNVKIENVVVENVNGEGLMVGYSGYLAKNININNCTFKNNARNEVALIYCDNVNFNNCIIDGVDCSSALLDIEKHSQTDYIFNVSFNNCVFNQNQSEAIKILAYNHNNLFKNISFNNCNINSRISIDKFNDIKFIQCSIKGIEIIASKYILFDGCVINSNSKGVFMYNDGVNRCENITFINSSIYGDEACILIQESYYIKLINCNLNNSKVGVGVYYGCKNVEFINSNIINNEVGFNYVGRTYTNNIITNCIVQNTENYKNMIANRTIINGFVNNFMIANNDYKVEVSLDNLANINIPTTVYTNMIGILKQSSSSGWIQNGMIFEDTDGKLKYKNRSGVISILSN